MPVVFRLMPQTGVILVSSPVLQVTKQNPINATKQKMPANFNVFFMKYPFFFRPIKADYQPGKLNARLNYTLIPMKFIIGGYVWYMVT